uniref:Uncharacterized protein n=1 Tax=Parascaris univalens TaxID=6257 RepID=A0A915A6S2_PARUN
MCWHGVVTSLRASLSALVDAADMEISIASCKKEWIDSNRRFEKFVAVAGCPRYYYKEYFRHILSFWNVEVNE